MFKMQESKTISPKLNVPQAKFIALDKKFKAFVAGFGSGKTWVGCAGIAKHMWEYPKINAGYFAPTFPQIRDIFYQTMEEVAFHWGLSVDIKTSDKEVHFYNGATYRGVCICRSMDNPSSIVGFKIGHAMVDEIDILKQDKATLAWRKIIARMRYKVEGLRNGIDVTTTPEGFGFVYEQFVKSVRENPKLEALYGLVQASTYDNEKNLPDGYIESLYESYPKQLIEAYLNGRFVNLTSGTIYSNFDRKLNHSDAELKSGEPLHIGMDFNVLQMAAVIYVIRDGNPIAIDELTEVRDTPTMAYLLKERYPNHAIRIYPDASGHNTSSKNASDSDLSILKEAGFTLVVDTTNPRVKDRIMAMQAMLLNGEGKRRLLVNTHRCPKFTEGLEQQVYDKHGEPDKSSGVDHVNDAGTYPIIKLFPIVKRQLRHSSMPF